VAKVPTFNKVSRVVSGTIKKATSKIGPIDGITDRNNAKPSTEITAEPGLGDNRSLIDTYFTSAPQPGEQPQKIYQADRTWARVTLTLETAGPVSVGTATKLFPVQGGGGRLLITNQPITFTVAKGTQLYVASTGVNRVGRVIEPVPWLEQIVGVLGTIAQGIMRFATGKRS
jgi:hypothetical protein